MSFGQKLLELVERSVIVQSLVALSCIGAIIYLYVAGKPVPDTLVNITLLVLGYYFGSKVQTEATYANKQRHGG